MNQCLCSLTKNCSCKRVETFGSQWLSSLPAQFTSCFGVVHISCNIFFFLALTRIAKKLFIQGRDIAVENVVLHVEEKQSVVMRTCLYYVALAVL